MANLRYQRYLNSLREVNAECQKLGIPYNEFVEVAQILLDTKRSKPEFNEKAKAFLSSISKYASERCKVLGLKGIEELRNADPDFLQKAFRYHVTMDGKLDKNIAQFATYCHVKLDMFSFKDMENLRKDICKQMKIEVKEDDPHYWESVLRALPSYMQGDYPAKKPSIFERIKMPDFSKMMPLTARYDVLLKTLYPEALEAYGFTTDANDIEKEILVLGFDDTRAAMKKEMDCQGFTLYSANNVYLVCLDDGCILYEGLDSSVFFNLFNQANPVDPNAWINERLALIPKPIYFGQQAPSNAANPSASQRVTAGVTPIAMGYVVYDLTPAKEAYVPDLGRVERSEKQFVLYHGKQKVAELSTPDEAPNLIGSMGKYGVMVTPMPKCAIFINENNNYLLVDKEGTVVYVDTELPKVSEVAALLEANQFTEEYKMNAITDAYGEVTRDEIRTFLSECALTLKHPHLPVTDIAELFCLTPLIAKQINKI